MRKIYLIRHGEPEMGGEKRCLGCRSDPPLSENGRAEADRLAELFSEDIITGVFSSSMRRASETADRLSRSRWRVETLDGIREMDAGAWDGLSFSEIRAGYPELYERRSADLSVPPPGGETYENAAVRAERTVRCILARTEGDIAVVAHAGVNRAIISNILSIGGNGIIEIPQSYASINVLLFDGERLTVGAVGKTYKSVPDDSEISDIYRACETPENIILHCRAVWETALSLAEGSSLDGDILKGACLLHDICRTSPHHEKAAAEELRSRGYLRIADIVSAHHDCPLSDGFREEELLFLADKLTMGTKRVTLSERFAKSAEKCKTPEALAAHEKRRKCALEIMEKYKKLTEAI